MKFSAIAFDLDGTLYPNYRLYYRLIPFLLKEQRLLRAMGKARNQLRRAGEENQFAQTSGESGYYSSQARIMAEILEVPIEKVIADTEKLIYRGWEPHFSKIKLFPHVRETLVSFREAGIKLGLLSDFPPEIKLENLKIGRLWDVVVCSERVGCLKPHPASFLEMAELLKMQPEEILYVGNSIPYDVTGAHKAGMKAAHIQSKWGLIRKQLSFLPFAGKKTAAIADFCFSDYRQLCNYVLS